MQRMYKTFESYNIVLARPYGAHAGDVETSLHMMDFIISFTELNLIGDIQFDKAQLSLNSRNLRTFRR